jgi:hypothetical protein
MEGSRLYSSSFKDYAFIWKETFSQRQIKVYPTENSTHMPNTDTEEITERFVNHGCMDDVDRHLSRALQVGNFISSANIDKLRGALSAAVSEPMVLIDDRNNETVTREHLTGNCRPPRGPLNAHQLYAELTQQVRLLHIIFSCFMFFYTSLGPLFSQPQSMTFATMQPCAMLQTIFY